MSTTLALTATIVLTGVGLVAFVGQRGDDGTWTRWSHIGQAFGVVNPVLSALAVAAVIFASMAQSRGQRDQQAEISVRQLHVTLKWLVTFDFSSQVPESAPSGAIQRTAARAST